MDIPTRSESKRGCGYRQGGGLYLMAGTPNEPCPLLPVPLDVCPTCGEGVKPSRSWTWVDADELLGLPLDHGEPRTLSDAAVQHAGICPLGNQLGRAGLLWIGQAFYGTPQDFMAEAMKMGVSRRISSVPRELEIGKTWVLCAHREAVLPNTPEDQAGPGIFTLFKPTSIEYVVRGDEDDEELERMVKRGIQPVRVERADEQRELPNGDES